MFRLHLPPLRERRADIAPLARHFLEGFGHDLGKGRLALTSEAEDALAVYDWPGNVRELRNLMERAAVLAEGARLDAALLRPSLGGGSSEAEQSAPRLDLAAALARTEQGVIQQALEAADGSKSKAAALLGIGERTLWTKLKKHGLNESKED